MATSEDEIQHTRHRYSNVAEEPCKWLAPIEGFSSMPLVTLEAATDPLESIIPRIKTYVEVVKRRASNPADNLTIDESASIALYTMEWGTDKQESVYYVLNSALRKEDRSILKPWFLYLKLLLTALCRLPSIETCAYRGVQLSIEHEAEKYQVGSSTIWWGFSSCSNDRDISLTAQFQGEEGPKTLFIIHCTHGKYIGNHSYYKHEEEVLLLPGTEILVVNYEVYDNHYHEIHLRQIESKFAFLEAVSSSTEIENLRINSRPISSSVSEKLALHDRSNCASNRVIDYIDRYRSPSIAAYLIGQPLNNHDLTVIADELIVQKQCPMLFLRESGIKPDGAKIIASALFGNRTLERLFISQNKLGDEGVRHFARVLSGNSNTTLQQLCLGKNEITDDGIAHLAKMLESNCALTHIWLSSNKITQTGLNLLCDVLTEKNKTLQLLSLEMNKFRNDECVNILSNFLKNNKTLKTLNLNSCSLPKSGIKALKAIAKNKPNFELLIC